jgi:hypothetical protein
MIRQETTSARTKSFTLSLREERLAERLSTPNVSSASVIFCNVRYYL